MIECTQWLRISRHETRRCDRHFPISWLAEEDGEYVVLVRLEAADYAAFDERLCAELLRNIEPRLHFLTLRNPRGSHQGTFGRPITSFACSICLVRQYIEYGAIRKDAIPYVDSVFPQTLDVDCYQLTTYLMDIARPAPIMRCLQLPYDVRSGVLGESKGLVEWVIPHKGGATFLESCLSSLNDLASLDEVSVTFDEPVTDSYRDMAGRYSRFRFLQATPFGASRGAMIDHLARGSSAEYLLLQDFDALSCGDRRDALLRHLIAHELDIVSSHEVSVDDAARQVQAVRFGLQLGREMHPAMPFSYCFGGAMIGRDALIRAGGGSERPFAEDVEFLFRAVTAGLKIGGVNEFLLVRRRRVGSLSASMRRDMPSDVRQQLIKKWGLEFEKWRSGSASALTLSFSAQSSLRRSISFCRVL